MNFHNRVPGNEQPLPRPELREPASAAQTWPKVEMHLIHARGMRP
jgi:hypothetical protein